MRGTIAIGAAALYVGVIALRRWRRWRRYRYFRVWERDQRDDLLARRDLRTPAPGFDPSEWEDRP